MGDEHGSLFKVQALEGPVQLVSDGEWLLDVIVRWTVEHDLADLDSPNAPRAAGLAIAGSDQESAQPGFESVRLAHCPNVEPGREQCVLDGVGGELIVAEDQPSEPKQPVERGGDKCRECLVITVSGSEDEIVGQRRRPAQLVAVDRPRCPS
jgi:hypothetical protein